MSVPQQLPLVKELLDDVFFLQLHVIHNVEEVRLRLVLLHQGRLQTAETGRRLEDEMRSVKGSLVDFDCFRTCMCVLWQVLGCRRRAAVALRFQCLQLLPRQSLEALQRLLDCGLQLADLFFQPAHIQFVLAALFVQFVVLALKIQGDRVSSQMVHVSRRLAAFQQVDLAFVNYMLGQVSFVVHQCISVGQVHLRHELVVAFLLFGEDARVNDAPDILLDEKLV